MRYIHIAFGVAILILGASEHASAQTLRFGPGGIELTPREERRPVPPAYGRDDTRRRMFHLREECEQRDIRSCVRLGIIIGQNPEHQAEWRREHPELFSFERE